jgi:diguanylate cyclase (GGDEF)-like protein
MPTNEPAETHVLILCPSAERRLRFDALFRISGLATKTAVSLDQLVSLATSTQVDVLLYAAEAPLEQALEAVQKLHIPQSELRDIPMVVVFPSATPVELALQSLQLGAYDYLIEPFNEIELLTKITVLAKVKHAEDEFRELAIRDRLTGLYDRRYLFMRASEELSRAKRYSKPISCMVVDIDGLHEVNERYGAEAGDALLQQVAGVLNHAKREIDVLARVDGDVFVLFLYNTDTVSTSVVANRILTRLENVAWPFDRTYRPSVSIGISGVEATPELGMHAQELQHRAEWALQQAKRQGPGGVVLYAAELEGE